MSDGPLKAQVRTWMLETGFGYRKAAKHFGVSVDTAREWARKGWRDEPVEDGGWDEEGAESTPRCVVRARADAPPTTPDTPPARSPHAASGRYPEPEKEPEPYVVVAPPIVVEDARLSTAQRQALALLLDAQPNGVVARTVGASLADVRAWRRDPVFAGVLTDLIADRRRLVMETVDAVVPTALQYLRDVVVGLVLMPDKVRVSAALAILDRGGLPKVERIEHGGAVTTINVEGTENLDETRLRAMAGDG